MAYNPDPRFAADSPYWTPTRPVAESRAPLYVPPPTPATAIPRDVSFENPYAPYMEPVSATDMAPALYQLEAPPEGAPEARRGVLGAIGTSLRDNPFQWGQIASNLARGGGPSREKRSAFQELGAGIRGALSADTGVARAADMRVADNREAKAAAAEQAKAAAANMRMMQNAILADPNLDTAAKQYYLADPGAYSEVVKARMDGGKPTDDMREYNYAVSQGFEGNFTDFMTSMKKAGASSTNVTVGGEPFKPGQKKVDELYAQEYVDWRATGGFSDIDKQLGQLDEALKIIETSPGITGPVIGNLPDFAQAAINPDGTIAQNYVEEVVQRNLRVILGAQFTEKEGERLIARAYNPRLPPTENAKRVRRLITQIKTMAQTKEAAADYFEENGTLVGFQGRPPTVADIEAIDFGDGPGGSGGDPVGWKEYFK